METCQFTSLAIFSVWFNLVTGSGLAVADRKQVVFLPLPCQDVQWSAGMLPYLGVYQPPSIPPHWISGSSYKSQCWVSFQLSGALLMFLSLWACACNHPAHSAPVLSPVQHLSCVPRSPGQRPEMNDEVCLTGVTHTKYTSHYKGVVVSRYDCALYVSYLITSAISYLLFNLGRELCCM